MNFNKFTIKAQEAIQEAVNRVQSLGQQAVEPAHIMGGVLKSGEQIAAFIFQKTGANTGQIKSEIEKQEHSFPKVQGGEPYLSRQSNEILNKAEEISKKFGDEFVSIEPIILAILKTDNPVSKMLKGHGITAQDAEKAIMELRKGESVKSQSAEESYQALSKYAV